MSEAGEGDMRRLGENVVHVMTKAGGIGGTREGKTNVMMREKRKQEGGDGGEEVVAPTNEEGEQMRGR
ncbi:hypothetical protein Pmani_032343 [Petrolisthes manimaculis]|uniref:Uncharacterized protein n=1 Tax=Petrolisthes manimaculis TaxID=1843537 RepID=A0AAE1TRR5_9EUCA|nr:hypothetical protein Pmani_032343 [Petrolisthes manimaculis]